MKIALVKDITKLWTVYKPELEKYGADVVLLDIFKEKDLERLLVEDWDGFIWRAKHDPYIRDLAKSILYYFDVELGVKTFPSWNSYWNYDNKVAQSFVLKRNKINTPINSVFYDKEEALHFAKTTKYPIVFKASTGAGSSNVHLLKSKSQSIRLINKAFGKGIKTFFREDLQRNYVYFQEFLENNSIDYRIVCYRDERITGFSRIANKDGFASGSGEYSFEEPPMDLLKFIYETHLKLGNKLVMAYDVMKDNKGEWAITEMSVVYADLATWSGDSPTPTYAIDNNGIFERVENKENDHKYFMNLLARDWEIID